MTLDDKLKQAEAVATYCDDRPLVSIVIRGLIAEVKLLAGENANLKRDIGWLQHGQQHRGRRNTDAMKKA